jgi:hypothetical protein
MAAVGSSSIRTDAAEVVANNYRLFPSGTVVHFFGIKNHNKTIILTINKDEKFNEKFNSLRQQTLYGWEAREHTADAILTGTKHTDREGRGQKEQVNE